MEKAVLLLHVEKGPRKGETFDCTIKGKINIGRVLRGNTFAIKENAISQKHLLIEFKDNKWTLSDLDTSNGTILNDVRLPAHEPQDLKSGDVVKIGSETVIRVEVHSAQQGVSVPSPEKNKTLKSRPGRRRKADDTDKKGEVCNEVEENRSAVRSKGRVRVSGDGRVENVTLGEWFDQMEEWLPKHLSEVAENIIREIREQSQQLDAYICEKYKK